MSCRPLLYGIISNYLRENRPSSPSRQRPQGAFLQQLESELGEIVLRSLFTKNLLPMNLLVKKQYRDMYVHVYLFLSINTQVRLWKEKQTPLRYLLFFVRTITETNGLFISDTEQGPFVVMGGKRWCPPRP